MAAVVSMFSTIFCAVPDFKRLEPVSASGPTAVVMAMSAISLMIAFGLLTKETVVAPSCLA